RAELDSIGALLSNNTARAAFSHTVAGSLLTAGTFVAAVSAWWLVRSATSAPATGGPAADVSKVFRPAAILGCWIALIATVGLFTTGDHQGKLMFVQQPMKMASAESLCDTA